MEGPDPKFVFLVARLYHTTQLTGSVDCHAVSSAFYYVYPLLFVPAIFLF